MLRIGLILLALAFSAYALEKELHLRRVSTMLLDEQVRNRALSHQLREHSAVG